MNMDNQQKTKYKLLMTMAELNGNKNTHLPQVDFDNPACYSEKHFGFKISMNLKRYFYALYTMLYISIFQSKK